MNDQGGPSVTPVQRILLDTCILQYMGDKQLSLELQQYLLALVHRGFFVTLSDVSIFELLSGTTVKQEIEGVKTLDSFTRYAVDARVLLASSQLSTLYRRENVPGSWERHPDQGLSMADKIIAATAILTGSLILTADVHDFPRPFFVEAEEKLLYFVHKNKTRLLVLQILRPNIEVINQRFSERPQG